MSTAHLPSPRSNISQLELLKQAPSSALDHNAAIITKLEKRRPRQHPLVIHYSSLEQPKDQVETSSVSS